jgi:HK97 family phage prohead protease
MPYNDYPKAERTIETMEENKNERHIKSVVETDEEIVITFGKGEMEEAGYKEEDRAEPNELSVGDFVRWNTSGGNAYGVIIQIERDGEIEADSGFKVNGTADDPAALIRIYRYSSEEEAYIERKPALNVVHRFSTLEKFDAEVRSHKAIIEKREFRMENAEYEGNTIRGYAAVYNSDSEWMGGFYEQIATGAFDDVLDNDTRAYFNHDENLLLGRVSSGTLRLGTDARGLYYEVDLPNTSYANDLVELMKRGDVNQSSFAFLIDSDRWEERDGKTYRIIEKVSRLLDVSPVAQPAYPDATSELVTRNNTPESEGAEVEVKAEAEEMSDIEIFEYKLKLLKLD